MVQSVELVLDDDADSAVQGQWQRLRDAGLPSQALHTGASNRPHVTLAARGSMPDGVDGALARVVKPLPLPLVLGGLLCLPGRRCVLARLVVPSAALLRVQAEVQAVLDDTGAGWSAGGHFGPGRWTPHVTLARGLTGEQLATAVAVLSPSSPDLVATAPAVRRWDGDARRTWTLPQG